LGVSSSLEPAVETEQPSTESSPRRWHLFTALQRYPAYRRLWLGAFATALGQWMQSTALGWLALELTDSASFVGIVAFVAGVPFLLVSIPAGVLIDRFDRRRVLMACQGLTALLAVFVAGDVIAGTVRPWHLLVAGFFNGSLQAVLSPTQQSLVPRLVPRHDLTNAVGLMSAGQNLTRVVGPSVAGAAIGLFGTGEAFLLQAAALIVALVLIGTAAIPVMKGTAAVPVRSAFDGMRLILRRPDLQALFLLASIPTFFAFPYISFLSVFARDVLRIGPEGLGLLLAASGTGAVAGSLLVASGGQPTRAGRTIVIRTVAYGLVIAGVAASRSVYLSLPLLLMAGLLGANFMSANNALLQLRITDEMRGRVMGAYMLTWGLMPLGAMPMGLLAGAVGAPIAVASGAALTSILVALVGLTSRGLRDL
jgi:MFS family permease